MAEPLEFLTWCRQRCIEEIREYQCVFTRQEWVNGELRPPQVAEVNFRADRFSVDMRFIDPHGRAARVLYVQDQWEDDHGHDLAWVKPASNVLSLFVPRLQQPIHGKHAKQAARRSIDQFGFERTYDRIIRYCVKARHEGILDLRYIGTASGQDRPPFVFARRSPYTGTDEGYPDCLLIAQVDQEYLIPALCTSYSDPDGRRLLGEYAYSNVRLNPGFSADAFDPDRIGF
jgi:hypothetical protein